MLPRAGRRGLVLLMDSRLLMNRYEASGTGTPTFVGAELFDVIGTAEPTGLPELTSIVPLSETELYAPDASIVYDVASGSVVWSTDDVLERGDCLGLVSAVAGDYVIYATGHALVAQPWH